MQFRDISINDIDFNYSLFRLFPVETKTFNNLFLNIEKLGVLSPPILIEDKNLKKFIVVDGFKRLLSVLKSEKKNCSCLVMDYSADSFLKGFYLKFLDKEIENFDESLNFYAKSKLYKILSGINEIFPKINIKAEKDFWFGKNKDFINKIISFSKAPFYIQDAFLKGVIALPLLFDLLNHEEDEIKSILIFFKNLSPNLNRQRELLNLLEELAHIEDKDISEIINQNRINQIILDEKLSKPQKLNIIIKFLTEKRYPEMIKLKDKFQLLAKESGFEKNPKIIPPKNFENIDFKVELSFNSLETYINLCEKMSENIKKGYIEKFVNLT
ncbi:MAG: hypothetical protein RBR53_07675 [Desulforegulaceae bacterium]|nr:hypothetical protein [Desulforegulaceae bacterium]